jgi:hypothetical protein
MTHLVFAQFLVSTHRLISTHYHVRARDARIRVMRGQHQNRSIEDEAIEPPTTNIIM